MPPRYAYWTIIVDEQATAFRAGAKEDLLPTFNRLKEKHPSAKMMWFQNGKLWPSRIDAQEAMRARGELGRRGDERQTGGFRDRKSYSRPPAFAKATAGRQDARTPRPSSFDRGERPEWKPKSSSPQAPKPSASERPEWRPKGTFVPEARKPFRDSKPEWRPKGSSPDRRPARNGRPDWKSKTSRPQGPRTSRPGEKLEWTPKTSSPQDPKPSEKRKWVPKEEYKKSLGIEAKKDKNWRPGGEHKDPRQKYKDAKKAKWTRFKQTVRKRWEGKPGKKGSK